MSNEYNVSDRLLALEARLEAHRLLADYCHGIDKRDEHRFMSIWHPDAVWLVGEPFGDFHGHDAIRRALVEVVWTALPETHHSSANLVTYVTDDGLSCISDVVCVATDSTGSDLLLSATYTDSLVREDGVWRNLTRKVDTHFSRAITLG